jgi:hypothetical protein
MTTSRKEAIRKFKERKPLLGAFAIRCIETGRVWVGASRNLEATRNGSWFCLRHAGHPDKSLQLEWNQYGEAAFQYEILETLDADLLPISVPGLLQEKQSHWAAQLGARSL